MFRFDWFILPILATGLVLIEASRPAIGCCPAPPSGKAIVNADQTVIILWDAVAKMEHFIRKASFKSDADDFGFIVPSPTQPELAESGDAAFPALKKLTEPEVVKQRRPVGGIGCGCAAERSAGLAAPKSADVRVLQEKVVAGFHATVLEATSAAALTDWLRDHGYANSPEITAWAVPYVTAGWKFTAMKVAKKVEDAKEQGVTTAALRLSFKTDKPLFPYQEPDPSSAADQLNAKSRLLRIYFLAESRYRGAMAEAEWSGKVAWAGRVSLDDRGNVLGMLGLPKETGPADWWLTEFEDHWPYRAAPSDVTFTLDPEQVPVRRDPIVEYVGTPRPPDAMVFLLALSLVLVPGLTRIRHWFMASESK